MTNTSLDAGRELVGLLEGRVVLDRRRIEHDDVAVIAGLQRPALLDADVGRRKRGQPPHCVLQRGRMLVAHIMAEQPSDIAVGARDAIAT